MIYLIDGTNLLGRSGVDREAVDAKRELLRMVSSFARGEKAKATVYFDGPLPSGFASSLGAVTAVFSGARPADDLIVERIQRGDRRPWTVVTSDLGLKGRVAGRRVTVIDCAGFRRVLETSSQGESAPAEEDWAMYFSDAKNRNVL